MVAPHAYFKLFLELPYSPGVAPLKKDFSCVLPLGNKILGLGFVEKNKYFKTGKQFFLIFSRYFTKFLTASEEQLFCRMHLGGKQSFLIFSRYFTKFLTPTEEQFVCRTHLGGFCNYNSCFNNIMKNILNKQNKHLHEKIEIFSQRICKCYPNLLPELTSVLTHLIHSLKWGILSFLCENVMGKLFKNTSTAHTPLFPLKKCLPFLK